MCAYFRKNEVLMTPGKANTPNLNVKTQSLSNLFYPSTLEPFKICLGNPAILNICCPPLCG